MNANLIPRISNALVKLGARRDAFKVLAGSGLAAVITGLDDDGEVTSHRGRHKKRCRKLAQSCGRKKKCCNKSGLVKCGLSSAQGCNDHDKHCCGVDGSVCFKTETNNAGACECCSGFQCVGGDSPERSHCIPEGT
jgi:hypothetical protein